MTKRTSRPIGREGRGSFQMRLITSAPANPLFPRFGLVDGQFPSIEFVLVQAVDGCLSFFATVHLDKAKAFRATRVPVHDDLCGLDRAKRAGQGFELGVGRSIS